MMIGKHFAPFMFNVNFDIDVQKLFTNICIFMN